MSAFYSSHMPPGVATMATSENPAQCMESDEVLIHVGYIKTATTFLQKRVFSDTSSGLQLAAGNMTRAHLVHEILLQDDFCFDAPVARNRLEVFAASVRQAGYLPVWSEEMLLGDPPSRRYDGFANARKLQMIYPQAKILITIRNQASIALSMYRQYVLAGGALPLTQFIGTGKEPVSFSPILRTDFLHYDRAIRHYIELFGRDNVLVLPQEMLSRDAESYFARLSAFTGRTISPLRSEMREHVGEGAWVLSLRRLTNRFILLDPLRPGRQGVAAVSDRVVRLANRVVPARWSKGTEQRWREQVGQRYADVFGHSNQRLEKLTGLPLIDLGYAL